MSAHCNESGHVRFLAVTKCLQLGAALPQPTVRADGTEPARAALFRQFTA